MAANVSNGHGGERNTPGVAFNDLLLDSAMIKRSTGNVPPISSLKDLDTLDPMIAQNVSNVISDLTPVQRNTMPALMRGINVLGCSYTGSGKTAAFLVPVLNNILKMNDAHKSPGLPAQPLGLVLAPTRELAIQIRAEAQTYCRRTLISNSIHLVCGGKNMEMERTRLTVLPCAIVVATVGRLMDLIEQQLIDLGNVKYFVLDEADVMMVKGFYYDVINLWKKCSKDCVSAMFSATYPNAVRKAAETILGRAFMEVQVGEDGPTASKTIVQEFQLAERSEKNYLLKNTLGARSSKDKVIVFGSTIEDVDRIHHFLIDEGYTVGILHAGLESQRQREFALNEFKLNNVSILVATSVAARGLDIPNVDLVINYDLPTDIEEYILRIGRTGRVGNKGQSLSYFEIERDGPLADSLISSLKRADQAVPGWLNDVKTKFEEDVTRFNETHDIGEFTNRKRIFNAYGSSIVGIPCTNEVQDDTWD